MAATGLSEPEAFRRLRKLTSDKNRKLVDIAQAVVAADEAMRPSDAK